MQQSENLCGKEAMKREYERFREWIRNSKTKNGFRILAFIAFIA